MFISETRIHKIEFQGSRTLLHGNDGSIIEAEPAAAATFKNGDLVHYEHGGGLLQEDSYPSPLTPVKEGDPGGVPPGQAKKVKLRGFLISQPPQDKRWTITAEGKALEDRPPEEV